MDLKKEGNIMANIRPFQCIRPNKEAAKMVAALPYDVYNREEAKQIVESNPYSFLAVDRAETQLEDSVNIYSSEVYDKAKETLEKWEKEGILLSDLENSYYLYELVMDGRSQTGIVACASVDDYCNGVIAKHENTRADKEQDRIHHIDMTDAHTGPIFLAYRSDKKLHDLIEQVKQEPSLYDFTSEDGVKHRVWKIKEQEKIVYIQKRFTCMDRIYIADGHHRAASAVKVALKRREQNPKFTGEEPFNYFLSVLFPDDQLMIMPYNRVVKDLNGRTTEGFLAEIQEWFQVNILKDNEIPPQTQGQISMYIGGDWYSLKVRQNLIPEDPMKKLDVSLLQDLLLEPVLGIHDPRTDSRIQFVGGIRGIQELERMVDHGAAVAFAMYPTSIQELFAVADAGLLMPPKSTWFEPKLRSGLFIHRLSEDKKD